MTDMSHDPRRAGQLTQQLLRAVRDDLPPQGAELRALSALELSVASPSAASLKSATPTVHASRLMGLKWLGAGAVLALLAFTFFPSGRVPTSVVSAPAPSLPPKIAPMALAPSVSSLAPAEPLSRPSLALEPQEPAPKMRTRNLKVGLHEELLSLEAIRKVLASGDARASLRLLAVHERTYVRGRLLPEAALLRVQALGKAGDTQRAATLAEKLLHDNPRTQYAGELSQWLVEPR